MKNEAWYKNPEMIVALSALLISLVTAVVSIYSAYIDRFYARASFWPRLEIYQSYSTGKKFGYGVANNGNGPALIQYARVSYQAKPINNWRDIPALKDKKFTQSHFGTKILSPEHTVTPILYQGSEADTIQQANTQVTIELCYCSVYQECWLIDKTNDPQPIEHCTINEKERFLQ